MSVEIAQQSRGNVVDKAAQAGGGCVGGSGRGADHMPEVDKKAQYYSHFEGTESGAGEAVYDREMEYLQERTEYPSQEETAQICGGEDYDVGHDYVGGVGSDPGSEVVGEESAGDNAHDKAQHTGSHCDNAFEVAAYGGSSK